MLHTYVGDDENAVREKVRAPMVAYLRTCLDQYSFLAGETTGEVRKEDVDTVLGVAFENYYASLSLLGHPDKCVQMIDRLRAIGADEAACLIDFGADTRSILEALPALAGLRGRC